MRVSWAVVRRKRIRSNVISERKPLWWNAQGTCGVVLWVGFGDSGGYLMVPDSTRFQTENRNRGSTLLKNRVSASVGSGAECFKYRNPRAAAPVRYLIPKATALENYPILRTNSRLQSKYPILFDEQPTKCNSRPQWACEGATHTTDANRNVCHCVVYKLAP